MEHVYPRNIRHYVHRPNRLPADLLSPVLLFSSHVVRAQRAQAALSGILCSVVSVCLRRMTVDEHMSRGSCWSRVILYMLYAM